MQRIVNKLHFESCAAPRPRLALVTLELLQPTYKGATPESHSPTGLDSLATFFPEMATIRSQTAIGLGRWPALGVPSRRQPLVRWPENDQGKEFTDRRH